MNELSMTHEVEWILKTEKFVCVDYNDFSYLVLCRGVKKYLRIYAPTVSPGEREWSAMQ